MNTQTSLEDLRAPIVVGNVTVTRVNDGHFYMSHPVHGEIELKDVAFRGRFRIWQRIKGAHGLKRGKVLVRESQAEVQDVLHLLARGKIIATS